MQKQIQNSTGSLDTFWAVSVGETLTRLKTGREGLTTEEAEKHLALQARRKYNNKGSGSKFWLLLAQFKSPIILLLLFAAGLSVVLRDAADAYIIFAIISISSLLGYWQERGAADAVQKLLATVQVKTTVLRQNAAMEVPVEEVVPGDIVLLKAGNVIPGDSLLIEAKDLSVDEATLTGETFPVEKTPGILDAETPLNQRTNTLFMGTHVISGTAKAVVARTGKETEFGKVSASLQHRTPETNFERGIRQFGYLLMEVTLLLTFGIFAINMFLQRPVLESFLFALALAVGLTPQLLPAIVTVNLSHGARKMAEAKVIVKRLASIENFGSMDVLCSDKTGTLTEGSIRLHSALDSKGEANERTLQMASLNAYFQTGYANPIDEAILAAYPPDTTAYARRDEIPYDFARKLLSVLLLQGEDHLLVTKGALANVLAVCATTETSDGNVVDIAPIRAQIQQQFEAYSREGMRTLGIAYRNMGKTESVTKADEKEMTFLGFLLFEDPLRTNIVEVIQRLNALGITLKIITGDNPLVAASISRQAGMANPKVLTGSELRRMSEAALVHHVRQTDVFAEVEPNQKERLILALKKAGHVVGYMGDGINDAPALHAADVGISVSNAVDVAKEAAAIVLLEKDLAALERGVREGRITFANTMKYIFMATSANFGNMFSMAGASLLLPFLPLLPRQILLANLMTDFPEMTIASDRVDDSWIEKPQRWDIGFIRRFMVVFGLISSVFDYATFAVLLWLLKANPAHFRTGWFVESVVSASMIVLVVRTRQPFFRSQPSRLLSLATLLIVAMILALPYTPLGALFDFRPLPLRFYPALFGIVILYIFAAEAAKRFFYSTSVKQEEPYSRS